MVVVVECLPALPPPFFGGVAAPPEGDGLSVDVCQRRQAHGVCRGWVVVDVVVVVYVVAVALEVEVVVGKVCLPGRVEGVEGVWVLFCVVAGSISEEFLESCYCFCVYGVLW